MKELTELIESAKTQLYEKLKEVDGKRKENSKEIKILKQKLDQKANKDQIVAGQLEVIQTVVQQETETETHLDRLLKEEFSKLANKLNYEMTLLNGRMTVMEKSNEAQKLIELVDSKLGRYEF